MTQKQKTKLKEEVWKLKGRTSTKFQPKLGKGVFTFEHPLAKEIGFTPDKFEGWLGLKDGYIYISFIISKQRGKGNLSKLFDKILSLGYGIKVPTPFASMEEICRKKGFRKIIEHDRRMGNVEVWVKEVGV